MNDGPEWFEPKRYGLGAGMPIAWQGWVVIALFIGLLGAASLFLRDSWIAYASAVLTLSLLLLIITARTTKGGWRWRWGKGDDQG
jgi:hypothetical protein